MNWHYQVMRHVEPDGETWYGIHEFYPSEGVGGWTVDPVEVTSVDLENIRWQLEAMLSDLNRHGVKDYQ